MRLDNRSLLREKAFLAGEWVDALDGTRIPVFNPATGEQIAQVPDMGRREAARAIECAALVQGVWAQRTAADRADVLLRVAHAMRQHKEDLALIMTSEQGKPLSEARGEILYAAGYFAWYAEEARRVYGETIPSPWPGRSVMALREPIGVCAAITPWNFPSAMLARKLAPALAAGCAMVVKPSELTPLSAFAICVLAEEAGLPRGLLSCLTGAAEEVGAELCANASVRKLSFTGSTRVGRLLMSACAPTVKRLSLELGGNAPFIVFEDADVPLAIRGLIAAKFRNAGQTCVSPNRILVQRSLVARFVEELTRAVIAMKVGNGIDEGVSIGPLINDAAISKVAFLVQAAIADGAKLHLGGRRHALGGTFYEPTIIVDVRPDMALSCEEIFGPVLAVQAFDTESEAIKSANAAEYGLAAYFYTRNLARVMRATAALDFGMVGVNEGLISTEVAPFGGRKQSGFGREGSRSGLDEYLSQKYVCLSGGEDFGEGSE